MTDKLPRSPLPQAKAEPNIARHRDLLPRAPALDDPEQVKRLEQVERERVQLLLEKQELEEENARLRKEARVEVYPPIVSVPPPPATPTISSSPVDIAKLEKQIAKSKLGRGAMVTGVLLAIAWNAFNTARATIPEQKADAASAKASQNAQLTEADISARIIERQRTLQALRAMKCWGKQVRGALQRQGLDLISLPSGGIKVTKVGDDDPNRPSPPRFIVEEKCPDFPELPPDATR